MKKFAVYALAGMLALPVSVASAQSHFNQKGGLKPIQVPSTQTPTPVGFSSVLCVADGLSGITLPPGPIDLGPVHIEALSPAVLNGDVSTISISITNNTTSTTSAYVVTFVDTNADNALGCGDTVISIVPAS